MICFGAFEVSSFLLIFLNRVGYSSRYTLLLCRMDELVKYYLSLLDEPYDLLHGALAGLTSEEMSLRISNAMQKLCVLLNFIRESSSVLVWMKFCKSIPSHPILALLLQDPFTKRARDKPRGYAGDAQLLDYIYFFPKEEVISPLGLEVQRFTRGCTASFAVRERALTVSQIIDEMASQSSRHLKVLSIACGHARELASSDAFLSRKVTFFGLDHDDTSLTEMHQQYQGFNVKSIHASIGKILKREKLQDVGEFDLIYSCGLFDYLSDDVARKLIEVCFQELLGSNGRLIVVNFMDHFTRGYVDAIMDWKLNYRTLFELSSLAKGLPSASVMHMELFTDSSNAVAFLDIAKISGNKKAVSPFREPSDLMSLKSRL